MEISEEVRRAYRQACESTVIDEPCAHCLADFARDALAEAMQLEHNDHRVIIVNGVICCEICGKDPGKRTKADWKQAAHAALMGEGEG